MSLLNLRKLFFIACALMPSLYIGAYPDGIELYVAYSDNTKVGLDLAHLRSISFSYKERIMMVHYADGSNRTHDYSRVAKMYFGDTTNGISYAQSEALPYVLKGTFLYLDDEVDHATLYYANGVLALKIIDRVTSLEGLPAGVYILRVEHQNTKLCVR